MSDLENRLIPYTGTGGCDSTSYYQPDHMEIYNTSGLRDHANSLILGYQKEIEELERQNKLMRDGLEFYSNDDNWINEGCEPCDVVDRDNLENGKRARQVLAKLQQLKTT